ncbi:MAG TPA: hypothetical protein VLM44_08695 [Lutibacter sp.]|nr:hypothetical protein [Lutibacter sp.]
MKNNYFFLLALFLVTFSFAQSKIDIVANYQDAEIFKMNGNEVLKPALGTGSVKLSLSSKESNKIVVKKEGFQDLIKEFPKSQKWPKTVNVLLEARLVKITATPFDAQIFVDGNFVGTKDFDVIIPKDGNLTLEIRKKGFKSITKTYFNKSGAQDPPISENFQLKDRIVRVKVLPADAEILVNKKPVGIGFSEIIIPDNECVVVQIVKEGFLPEEKVFCNKENDVEPPFDAQFLLKDRLVKVESTPNDAEIKVDGKIVGIGSYDLKVSENNCVEIIVSKESFLTVKKNYCNSKDYQQPPHRDHIQLVEDEAYKTSISTDLANVNFTVVVNPKITEDEAWKLISTIVTTEFDVLEVVDKETGYMRTAWQVQSFNGKSTIRTRVFVKLGDSNPLKYVIKISSERADGLVSVKDDQEFEEWNRILKKYQNIIEEAQSRL